MAYKTVYIKLIINSLQLFFSAGLVYAQSAASYNTEMGHPLSRFYDPTEYHGHGENFSIVQDKSGIMYFANFKGVLEFDGVKWNTITTTNIRYVSTLFRDSKGRILVGANGEFGYLNDSLEARKFVSISAGIKDDFGAIIQITELGGKVYFVAKTMYYVWDGKTVRRYPNLNRAVSAFPLKDKLLILRENGLVVWDGKVFTPIVRPAHIQPFRDIVAVVPIRQNVYLLFTSSQGVYRLDNNYLSVAPGNMTAFIGTRRITHAIGLSDGNIILSMSKGGMVVVNRNGNVLYPVHPLSAYEDSQIRYLFNDREGNLWLALNDGIAKAGMPSPITKFDNQSGLKGEVTAIRRFRGSLYIGTLYGLYKIENNAIVQVSAFKGGCTSLEVLNDGLLIGANNGVFFWNGTGALQQLTSDFTLSLKVSRTNPSLVFAGFQDGAGILKRLGNRWTFSRIDTHSGKDRVAVSIVGFEEDIEGNLWMETLSNGVFRVDKSFGSYHTYGSKEGIGSLFYNRLSYYDGKLLLTNKDGILLYNKAKDKFAPYNFLSKTDSWFDNLRPDDRGNIWATRGDKKRITFYKKDSRKAGFIAEEMPLRPVAQLPFSTIYPENNQITWLGGEQGLYRIDLSVKIDTSGLYPVLLRSITAGGKSLLSGYSAQSDTLIKSLKSISLKPDENTISMEYSLPSFYLNQQVEYQVLLDKYDKKWSDWSSVPQRDYSGLPPGSYRFHVRARDVYHNVSTEASFPFTILAPWYLKWYLVLLYVVLAALILYYIVRWRFKIVEREKLVLERSIKERTEEVVNQKEELEMQSEELSATNDQLERIDEFVKAINSEVNTRKLFQLVLDRLCQFQNVDSASALIYDQAAANYQFIALSGSMGLGSLGDVRLSYAQAEQRYIQNGKEVYEDIFLKNNFRYENLNNSIDDLYAPKSLITILIRVDGEVKSFITLENTDHENAFRERDFMIVKNLKEHLIGAYIKTNILENLEKTLDNLKTTQEQLIRQERLASVGQLTKGIVDRILNPLNYINNFSQSSVSLLSEIDEVTQKNLDAYPDDDEDDVLSAMGMLKKNLEKIYEHGNSTTRIVKDMQKLLRGKATEFFVTELNPFLESKAQTALTEVLGEYKDGESIEINYDLHAEGVKVSILPFEFAQVITNLISNACYAVFEKNKMDKTFTPTVRLTTAVRGTYVSIRIVDNGMGIPTKEKEQLFNPFFTTKPTSKGTGLGLFMSKDIIEYHKGKITAMSKEKEFTEMEILLPIVIQ